MLAGAPGYPRLHSLKPKPCLIQFIDKHVNDPYRVILSDVVVQMLGEQCALRMILALDKSLHHALQLTQWAQCARLSLHMFSHALDPDPPDTSERSWAV